MGKRSVLGWVVALTAIGMLIVAGGCKGNHAEAATQASAGGTEFGGGLMPEGDPGPNYAAIEAARQIGLSAQRAEVLEELAQRDDLSTSDQLFLINVTCDSGLSAHQAGVLEALARNPVLSTAAELHLANELDCIGLSAHREQVAQALADRESE